MSFALLIALAAPLAAQTNPGVPDNFTVKKPVRPRGTGGYRGGASHQFLYPGTITEVGLRSVKVTSPDGKDTMNFVLEDGKHLPDNIKPGARVSVDYTATVEANQYKLVNISVLAASKKFPQAKGPTPAANNP